MSSSKSSGIEKKERGKEAKKEANTEKPVEELWSAWIWEKDLDLFYRARFREDSKLTQPIIGSLNRSILTVR